MQYILTSGWDDGVADLTQRLVQELAEGKKVLWLVTGGSNIPAATEIMANIPAPHTPKLTVMLADERFGPVGHEGSNEAQLIQAGFSPVKGTFISILQNDLDLEQTRQRYNDLAAQAFADNDVVIAQLGIGTDGHIAGIMLEAHEVEQANELVVSIDSQPWPRLTLSYAGLRYIDVDYTFAFGQPKLETLTLLHNETVSLSEQPAQILKELPEAYIYTDQLGEHRG